MHRRTFLGVVGGGLLLPGCTSDSNDGEGNGSSAPTVTRTPTQTPTATATPRPTPSMGEVTQLVHWTDPAGDVVSHRVDGTAAGSPTWLGYGADLPVHDGRVEADYELTVRNEAGDVAVSHTTSTATTVSGSGDAYSDDKVGALGPGTLSEGTYTAQVSVTDRVAGTTDGPATTTVSVVEPLDRAEADITFEGIDRVDGWSSVAMKWAVTNTSDRDSGVVTGLSVKPDGAADNRYQSIQATIGFDVPAGVERTYRSEGWNFEIFENVDEVTFRFDAYNFSWTVPVR